MSSTVSSNEEISAVRWLELRFESGYSTGVHTAREVIEIQDDHHDDCWFCERTRAIITDDGFWWRPPPEDVIEWYAEMAIEGDVMLDSWLESSAPMPAPAVAFTRGPEYPTGWVGSHDAGHYHNPDMIVT